MNITISYWVVYAMFLFLNINQGFWGLSLRPYRSKSSLLSMLSSGLPFGFATIFGIAMVIMTIMGSSLPGTLMSVFLQLFIAGLALGGSLYVIVLPFMILVMRSCFFRERFYACLRLKSMTSDDLVTGTEPESQQDSLERFDDDFLQP